MWIKYNRVLEGNQWIHPDFTNDGRTSEKYLSPTDNTLFLANTTVESFTGYEKFNIIEVSDINAEKINFRIGNKITKYAFRQRFTFEERVKLDNYEDTIDAMDLTPEDKENKKRLMKTITNDLNSAIELNLLDPSASVILGIFITCGIISAERMTEILAG